MPNYPKLKFKIDNYMGEMSGVFMWGNARNKLFERYYDAEDIEEPDTAYDELFGIIEDDPEFIDAYSSLGWWEIRLRNHGNAYCHFYNAFTIGNNLVPKNFPGNILWAIPDNRPFLNAMHGLGLTNLYMREWDKAANIFKKMLHYNPNDNQGVRALLIESYLAQGKFKKILSLCKMYPHDMLPDTMYGAVLAQFRLDNMVKAEEALQEAIEYSPNIAKELLKKKHVMIESDDPGTVTVGGEDEAWEYWERVGLHWTDPKLLQFIAEGLKKWGK